MKHNKDIISLEIMDTPFNNNNVSRMYAVYKVSM